MKRISILADGNKGLLLTRVIVKQSQEIEKVYEAVGSEISDSTIQQIDVSDFLPRDFPPEATSNKEIDSSNKKAIFSPNRKSLDWKTTSLAGNKQSKFISKVTSKFENETDTVGKENKMMKRYENEKLKESKKSFGRIKNGEILKTKPSKQNNLERTNLEQFSQSPTAKVTKSGRFSPKSLKLKPTLKRKFAVGDSYKIGTKRVRNFSVNDKFKLKRGKLSIYDNHKTKTTRSKAQKVKISKGDSNLSHLNNRSHDKLSLLSAPDIPKDNNTKNQERKVWQNLGKTYFSLKNISKDIQRNNTLKLGEETQHEHAVANVADIIDKLNRLPIKIQRRVIDEVLSHQHDVKRVPDTNSTIPAVHSGESRTISTHLSEKYIATSVRSKGSSNTSVDNSEKYLTTSVFPKKSSIKSVENYEKYSSSSVDNFKKYSTTSVDISEKYSTISAELSEKHSTAPVDIPYAYSDRSVDLSETFNATSVDFPDVSSSTSEDLPGDYSNLSIETIDGILEVSTSEKNVRKPNSNRSSSKTSEEAKFNSEMLKEFSEIYSVAPPTGDLANGFKFPSVSKEKSLSGKSSTENKQNSFPFQKRDIPRVRTKKNKSKFARKDIKHISGTLYNQFPQNKGREIHEDIKHIAGTLFNYFPLLAQDKKRGIEEDIPNRLKMFFDKMSMSSTARNSIENDSSLAPALFAAKPKEIEPDPDYDRNRIKESYYSDYEGITEGDVMDA